MRNLFTSQRFGLRGKHSEGFALLAVLWISGLLAVMATSFALQVRTNTIVSRHKIDVIQMRSIADSVTLQVAEHLAELPQDRLSELANGRYSACRWSEGVEVVIAIQDQGGLIDLNTASPALIASLLRSLGLDQKASAKLAQQLEDFRDADQVTQGGTDESKDYQAPEFEPKNAPLESSAELDQLPAMSSDLLSQILPLVTVHSQQPGIDPVTAPAKLMAVIEKSTDKKDIALLSSPSALKTFGIDVQVRRRGEQRFVRHAVVSLVRQPHRPLALLAWQTTRSPTENNEGQITAACLK